MQSTKQSKAPQAPSRHSRLLSPALIDVLVTVLRAGIDRLAPEFSSELGYYYPDVLRIAVKHKIRDLDALEELANLGAFEREYHDSMILCPNCGSHSVIPKFKCPVCGSERLRKEITLTHVSCGAVNIVERVPGSSCRKCGELLKPDNTVVIGVLYGCQSCGAHFETPSPLFKCAVCNSAFDHKDASYVSVYAYRVKAEEASRLAKQLIIAEVRSLAESAGLAVTQPAKARGQSGFEHTFDIAVSDGKKTTLIDVVASGPRAVIEALTSVAKLADTGERSHFVMVPKEIEGKVRANPAELLKTYEDSADIHEKVSRILEAVFGKKPRVGGAG